LLPRLQLDNGFSCLNDAEEGPHRRPTLSALSHGRQHEVFARIDHVLEAIAARRVKQLSILQCNVVVLRLAHQDLFIAMDCLGVVLLAVVHVCELLP